MKNWLALLLLLSLCSTARPSEQGPLQRVDSLLHARYTADAPGIAISIVEKGKTTFSKGYGISSLEGKGKISPATTFNIASLTKQFTAMAILQLAGKNKLSLDEKIGHFLPELNKKIGGQVTIRQLLNHSSGIVDHYAYTDTNNLHHAHNSTALTAIKNIDTTYFTPGSQFRYSNTAYCLLALVIERASGLSYAAYMQQYIFQPAGMKHTAIWNESRANNTDAAGYDLDSVSKRFVASGAAEHIFFSTEGDGGIYTTVEDYTKWFTALQSGNVFPKQLASLARSLQFAIDARNKTGYGMGWFVDEHTQPALAYHSGSNGGFNSYSFTIPGEGFAVVVFSNRSDINLELLVQQIINILLPGRKPFTKIQSLTS
ncbi:serine hydrolase domain-containing protein [Flavihumibacter profundi]|uniref:serine hydrolase domain-containing protein n=1 Tax=Flavihumibacter profundi TaxID=2716883 RepID=UPI001CC59F40|nr:serine hydrolase domain-containing protein [Flavihumibacter profundi]MBZ5858537.1 beta-lactamase family protein [Flavihumibacter profundi]